MTLNEQIMKLQTYKMFEGEDTVYVERDGVLKLLEQEPCDDAINREDALMALTGEWTEITDEIIHRFIKRIKMLPPVTPQPKTGHWIDMGDFEKCSACNGTHLKEFQNFYGKAIWVKTNYCPNCGARMQEVEE